ncbi:hypothetical protein V7S43_015745 [Phytophthora oleae]|uniref:BZIP domain-containing protein n=1 Tax=Phytophthora oleae TaxID=2107226 RepID=A0ABD3EXZ8_9STRA
MANSSLFPPNNQLLSDAVIGAVSVRTRSPVCMSNGVEGRQFIAPSTASQASWYKLPSCERSKLLHRVRRRRTQQRYRKKQQDKAISLEGEVLQLREKVKQRQTERQSFPSTVPLKVVVEYFRLFNSGFNPIAPVSELCSVESGFHHDPAYVQTQFFQTVMMPNVLCNAGYGVETALEDWRLVSAHHEKLSYNLDRVERRPGRSVVAYMTGITTITEKMLLMAFSDLSEGSKWTPLAAKLLGRRLEVPNEIFFHFDDSNSRVVSARYIADMLTPLLKLLESVEEAAIVLNSALDIHHWSKDGVC